jgi:phenylalanyl-tRNA synthetase beta chain
MKVSVNWLKKYTPIELPIDELVGKIGAQLGAVEEVINLGERYKDIVVARVVSCEKHPDADKLSVCWIDDGRKVENVERNQDGLVHIVCGAPNVAAGQLVAWLPPGSTVPATFDKDPLVLEARDIRGQKSNGMLASAKELAIGDSHSGILVIDKDVQPGADFAQLYELDDFIIDIENKMFTHRPDCFGMLGVAREIAGISGHQFSSPAVYLDPPQIAQAGNNLTLEVSNEASELVPRLMLKTFSAVEVKPSTVEVQSYLARVGVKPINSIVDLTNYFMLLTGQPMHAYDYDKVKVLGGGNVGARLSRAGEEIKLLNGKTLKLDEGAILITAGDKPIGLGGVMGGEETQVDESTKSIVLECATFDMNQTRKTAMKYGLFTDAVTRYTKGQSPHQNDHILSWASDELSKLGAVAASAYDLKADLKPLAPVSAQAGFINSRLGAQLTPADMAKLLTNVEVKTEVSDDSLTVTPPFWRTDIEIAEDLVEEVGRLYGYDNLKISLPMRMVAPTPITEELAFKSAIRSTLAAFGCNEALTYSFVPKVLLERAGQNPELAFHIRNALSPNLQYYRLGLTPSLLEKVHPNIKAGFDEFALFELGRPHIKNILDEEGLPKELKRLALVVASREKSAAAAYYKARNVAVTLLGKFEIYPLDYKRLDEVAELPAEWQPAASCYEPKRSAVIYYKDQLIGLAGEPTLAVKSNFKLPTQTAAFELDIEKLIGLAEPVRYYPLGKFPAIKQDICLRVEPSVTYQDLAIGLTETLDQAEKEQGYDWEIEPIDIYQSPDDTAHKQLTWRISLSHPERTLVSDEVNKLFDKIASDANNKFKAERV